MKEMKYHSKRLCEVLTEGDLEGYHYAILNLGTHPTAYVELKKERPTIESDIVVHGGITFNGKAYWSNNDTKDYIGWDYAHCGDYLGTDEVMAKYGICYPENKKWTTQEVYEDVKSVVKQLIVLDKSEATND